MERKVVITGIGALTPLAHNAPDTWAAMVKGECGIAPLTRFDTTEFKAKLAAEVKDFDPVNFGISKMDARKYDLFTQYAVATAKEAVEDSGIADNIDPARFGVYLGSGMGGISTMMAEHSKLLNGGPKKISPFFVPMMIINMASGTVAKMYGARGVCLPVVTACATSTNAIGEAYRAIKHGYADAIIAGGSEAAINELSYGGFISCMALSNETDVAKASVPFDKRRNGFVMGEGSATVILEDYDHAKARGAKIYAYVSGYGNTCDAFHMTAPEPEAIASGEAIRLAKEESGITSGENVYYNAHGTSTPLNDKTETKAIKNAFGEQAYKLNVSSTKSMTGHMLGAAGAIEAIACIMALKDGIAPPTINYVEPDPECDLNITPNNAVRKPFEYALSTSLGFGGHNACLAFKKA